MKKLKKIAYITASLDDQILGESNLSIEAKDTVAEIRISGRIASWDNSAAIFRRRVDEIIAQGIKDVNLYINTEGGSVFEANEIANEIQKFPGTIKGFGGALVASAGSYLAVICETFEMADNGQYMYHKPSGSIWGNEDQVASSLKLLQNLTKQYKTAYATKTGMSEEDIETNWSKGDVWLSAQEALDQGFITGISKPVKITKDSQARFAACGAPVVPEVNTNSEENEYQMKNRNQIIAKLKLAADATDEQIEQAIADAAEKASRVEAAEQKSQADHKASVETYVDSLITAKKATGDDKESLVAFGVADFEALKKMYDKKPAVQKLSDQLNPNADGGGSDVKANWSLQDYIDKDPVALEQLIAEDPAKFAELEAAHYSN